MKVGVIGGGIVGLSVAKLASEKGHKVILFEKDTIGQHQSGNNSGVLHCGLHYMPGSLKAKLAVEGIGKMIDYCEANQIKHDICGNVVVATDVLESKRLENLASRGQKNGLKGLRFLSNPELGKREPHTKAQSALLVPGEGIVDYRQVMRSFKSDILENDGIILEGQKVIGLEYAKRGGSIIKTKDVEEDVELVINCAGLYTDKVFGTLTKKKPPLKIVPFRGEYLKLKEEYKDIVNHLVYPTPNPDFPFLGVHFTRMINGGREVGPNAVLALKREGYTNRDFSLSEAIESLTYSGLLRFLTKNVRFSFEEFKSSLTLEGFVKKAKHLIPDVESYMFEERTAGVRAQAMSSKGELLMDFEIKRFNNQIHVLNAPSPGATASLAIAEYIIENYTEL